MLRPVLDLAFDTKLNNYLSSLFPRGLFDRVPNNSFFITGGFAPRLFHDCPIRDVDLFCTTDNYYEQIRNYFLEDIDFTAIEHGSPISTRNGRPYLTKFRCISKSVDIDLVRPSYNLDLPSVGGINGEELYGFIKHFDFTAMRTVVTKMVEDRWMLNTIVDELDYDDLRHKKLNFTGNILFKSPKNNTLLRMAKYMNLGFSMSNDDYTKLVAGIYEKLIEEEDMDSHAFTSYGPNQGDIE